MSSYCLNLTSQSAVGFSDLMEGHIPLFPTLKLSPKRDAPCQGHDTERRASQPKRRPPSAHVGPRATSSLSLPLRHLHLARTGRAAVIAAGCRGGAASVTTSRARSRRAGGSCPLRRTPHGVRLPPRADARIRGILASASRPLLSCLSNMRIKLIVIMDRNLECAMKTRPNLY